MRLLIFIAHVILEREFGDRARTFQNTLHVYTLTLCEPTTR